MQPRAVSFDAHGTLILPQPSVELRYQNAARHFGVELDPAAIMQHFLAAFKVQRSKWDIPYGANADDARAFWYALIRDTFEPLWPGSPPEELCAFLFEDFGRGSSWRLLPHAQEAIALARQYGLPVAIASNFDHRLLKILDDLAIHTDVVVISAMIGAAKPNPAFLQHTAAELGIAPNELLHAGDNPKEDGGACEAVGARWLPVDREHGIDLKQLDCIINGQDPVQAQT